jgi:hypothetical protein
MQTVYQVSRFNMFPEILPGLVMIVVGVIMASGLAVWRGGTKKIGRLGRLVFLVFYVPLGIIIISNNVVVGECYIKAMQTGQWHAVEGTVTVREVGWRSGHGHPDRIQIGADEFHYYAEGLGYHWIIVNGGPLTNGVYARLHVFDGHILKVEIER